MNIISEAAQEEEIWLELANLFFLDTEPEDADYYRVAARLTGAGWTKQQTISTLIKLIGPVAGENLGYLIWPPVAPAWAGFDRDYLVSRIRHLQKLRTQYPNWYFIFSDWKCRRMLRLVTADKLLVLLP